MNELVSIITPSYNTAEFIGKTIESVRAQTYQNWEMIIVDDCSSDDTDSTVVPYLSDTRIKYTKNETNSGAAVSRNRALREARGRWIAFLDSDDLWVPNKLEKQIAFMEDNGYHFSYTNYEEIDNASIDDMICMAHCKHGILSASTFSWWGNWIRNDSKTIIVAPSGIYCNEMFIPDRWLKL